MILPLTGVEQGKINGTVFLNKLVTRYYVWHKCTFGAIEGEVNLKTLTLLLTAKWTTITGN